jgi:hypothetical protein
MSYPIFFYNLLFIYFIDNQLFISYFNEVLILRSTMKCVDNVNLN